MHVAGQPDHCPASVPAPCGTPHRRYSNKRWCCGDMDHMDISVWAFEKLADKKWGVIGIQVWTPDC